MTESVRQMDKVTIRPEFAGKKYGNLPKIHAVILLAICLFCSTKPELEENFSFY